MPVGERYKQKMSYIMPDELISHQKM